MRRILTSLGMVVFAGAVVVGATGAFFSDTETSSGNTFSAGSIDLQVDSQAHYAGLVCDDGVWADDPNVQEETTRPDLLGDECEGTWTLTDLGPENTFFNLGDLKPGDEGENTISLHVENNDAYVCAIIDNLVDDDNGLTEPEGEDGDVTPGPLGGGELSSEINFFAWEDNGGTAGTSSPEAGNNIWDDGEVPLFADPFFGPASDVLGGVTYPLYTPQSGALPGGSTTYVGLAWCYGAMTVDTGTETLTCDGGPVDNITQTDSMEADIAFYVEQARNNEDFVCPAPDITPGEDEDEIGANLNAFADAPSCDVTATTSINGAIGVAAAGNTVCVPDGSFTENVVINKDITLSGSGATSTSVINGNVSITADGATLEGFEINGRITSNNHDITIQYNKVTPVTGNAIVFGGTGISGDGSTILHNVVNAGSALGIYLDQNGTPDFVVDHNTVSARKSGFGDQGTSGTVQHNVFNDYDVVSGVGWEVNHDAAETAPVISINNFNESAGIGVANLGDTSFDAPSNWWGDASSAGNISGNVTTSNDQAAPYPQF